MVYDRIAEMFKLIKEAKEILLDEEKRKAYDSKHKSMLMKRAGKEKMDKRQREMTEKLQEKEEAGTNHCHLLDVAKRRRQGELTEKEKLQYRLMQIHQENEKIINQMLQENQRSARL